MRELRNLVESMVVLAPGHEIGPDDIPPEVRSGGTQLPVPLGRSVEGRTGDGGLRPELEFIFRTLVELRMDMDDLRREFDAYREDIGVQGVSGRTPVEIRIPSSPASERPGDGQPPPAEERGLVVYRPGMTMDDLERAAILAALQEEGGNRRRAAEMLGIGERTLYRKIKQYGLEV